MDAFGLFGVAVDTIAYFVVALELNLRRRRGNRFRGSGCSVVGMGFGANLRSAMDESYEDGVFVYSKAKISHHQWPFQDPKLEVPTIYIHI